MQAIGSVRGAMQRVGSKISLPGTVMMPLATGVPTPKIRVLVGDDEEIIVQTLAVILDLAGYDACALYDGQAALRLLNLFKPNLVITDVTASSVTGIECSSAAPLVLPRCKILLFTGYADLHDFLRDRKAVSPPFELLTRPILPKELLAKLKGQLCSEYPPLLVPIDTSDATIH